MNNMMVMTFLLYIYIYIQKPLESSLQINNKISLFINLY